MSSTESAIQASINGGWNPRPEKAPITIVGIFPTEFDGEVVIFNSTFVEKGEENGRSFSLTVKHILLDPSFWRALSKERKWIGTSSSYPTIVFDDQKWLVNMHGLIDALASGSSIEEYFESLEKEV